MLGSWECVLKEEFQALWFLREAEGRRLHKEPDSFLPQIRVRPLSLKVLLILLFGSKGVTTALFLQSESQKRQGLPQGRMTPRL